MPYQRKTVDLFVSEELKSVLSLIKDDSVVAKMLLKSRQNKVDLVESSVNYISISIQDRGKISYVSHDRMSFINESEYWTSPRRYQAKPGAFVSKIFKNISQKEIEKFSTLFKSISLMPKFTFLVVKGDDIKKYYHWESYAKDRGTLGVSCMRHDNCQRLLNIYSDSSDISMLVMLDSENKLMGRALLWNTYLNKIMDRIYTIDDESLRFHFKKWATDNNYWYKSEQNWYNTLQFEQLGKEKVELEIEVKMSKFRQYPYMDTFKFVDTETNSVFNYIPKESENIRTLVACDGSKYDGDYLRFDSIDRIFRYRGETVYISYLNIYTHENNTRWSRLNDKYILVTDSKYSDKLDDYIFIDDSKNVVLTVEPVKKRKTKISTLTDALLDTTNNFTTTNSEIFGNYMTQISPEGLSWIDTLRSHFITINRPDELEQSTEIENTEEQSF